uniref:Uncharacterized protein n=1 Tax=viral metagenome TaxID=1070528 RepID=A0A6M3M1P6_9ZZZZ
MTERGDYLIYIAAGISAVALSTFDGRSFSMPWLLGATIINGILFIIFLRERKR